jgi:predicted peroxiredoxin
MSERFVVNLTHANDNPDHASVAFLLANAAVASGKETVVFLSVEGVRLAMPGFAHTVHEPGFQALPELMSNFVEAGGRIFLSAPCFKKRRLDPTNLVPGASLVSAAQLLEFMSPGASSLSY